VVAIEAIAGGDRSERGDEQRAVRGVARRSARPRGGRSRRRVEQRAESDRGGVGDHATAGMGGALVGEGRLWRERRGDHGVVLAARTAGEVDARKAPQERAPVLVWSGERRGPEEAARTVAVCRGRPPGREEAKVADLDEARG